METVTLKKQIDVTKQVRENIKKVFKVSTVSIWRALSFNDNSDVSQRIRKFAKINGGVVMVLIPETETIHDCNGFMRQYMNNGSMIEVDKNSGHLDVYDKDGRLRQRLDNCTVQQLYIMQEFANRL